MNLPSKRWCLPFPFALLLLALAIAVFMSGCTTVEQCAQRHGNTYCKTWLGKLPLDYL